MMIFMISFLVRGTGKMIDRSMSKSCRLCDEPTLRTMILIANVLDLKIDELLV